MRIRGTRHGRTKGAATLVAVALALAGCLSRTPSSAPKAVPTPDPEITGSIAPAVPTAAGAQAGADLAYAPSALPPVPGLDGETRISTATLVAHVRASNPDVRIAEARTRDQLAGVELARTAYNPTVEVTAGMGPEVVYTLEETGAATNRKEVGVAVSQHLFDFGIVRNDVLRASLAHQASVDRHKAQSEATVEETVVALLAVMELQDLVAVARKNVTAHQTILSLIETNEANGNASVADTKRVTTRLEQAKSALIDLTTDLSDAEDAFRRLTDLDPHKVDGAPLLGLGGTGAVDEAVLETHPSIRALKEEVDSLRAQIASVRAERLPTISLDADAKFRDDVGGLTDPGVTAKAMISIQGKIWDGGEASAVERQLQARVEETLLKLDKQRRDLREEADTAARVTRSGGDKKAALAERLTASRKVADLQLEQFKDGAVTLFELLDSQSERQKAEADAITAAFEERRAAAKSLALALRLTDTLTAGAPPPGVATRPRSLVASAGLTP